MTSPANTTSRGITVTDDARDIDQEFDRIDSSNALEPGNYWTAKVDVMPSTGDHDVDEYDELEGTPIIAIGETLLLIEVIEFEDRVHSVRLLCPPTKGEGHHTLLLGQFLDSFTPCSEEDALAQRQREQQAVMNRVSELQTEMMVTQSSPQLMNEAIKADVEAGLREFEQKSAQRATEEAEARSTKRKDLDKIHRRAARRSAAAGNPLVAPKVAMAKDVGGFINAGINESGVEELTKIAGQRAVVANATANWLSTKAGEIAKTLSRLAPFVKERAAVALARSSAAVAMAERIKRGITSLDLYTGKAVEVYDVCVGREAPETEKLTLVQSKRIAMQELAAWDDVTEDFDFENKKEFFTALATNSKLLNQVLPTPRCVVSIAMRDTDKSYGNWAADLANNLVNQRVFLLVRNGENVHAVYSSSASHEGVPRLFPTNDDMDRPFRGLDGSRVSIRDVQFGERMERFENLALCYRRFLILLCGLDHRLGLLGRFYPPAEQMNFMTAKFQEDYFHFLADDETSRLIGDKLPSLESWFAQKNKHLQSGSRVFLMRGENLTKASPALTIRENSLRINDESLIEARTVAREGDKLYVTVQSHDMRYGEPGPMVKVYLSLMDIQKASRAWWVCIDGVDVQEVRRFRHSRVNRALGTSYLLLLRRLERHLDAERVEQADARAYLKAQAIEHGGLQEAEVDAQLDTAIRNWRASRRGAPLPPATDLKSLNEVLSLLMPPGRSTQTLDKMLDAYLASTGSEPLLLTRSGKAKLMLYVVASEEDKAQYPNVLNWRWVKRITLEAGKTKLKVGAAAMVWLLDVLPASEVVIREWPGLPEWQNKDAEPLPIKVYEKVRQRLQGAQEWAPILRAGFGAGFPEPMFQTLLEAISDAIVKARESTMPDLTLAIPIGVTSADGVKMHSAYMKAHADRVLYAYGNESQRARVLGFFDSITTIHSRHNIRALVKTKPTWVAISTHSTHDIGHTDVSPRSYLDYQTKRPEWLSRSGLRNVKRKEAFFSHEKEAMRQPGPKTKRHEFEISLDRGIEELMGVSTRAARRSFYRKQKSAADAGVHAWVRNHRWSDEFRDQFSRDDDVNLTELDPKSDFARGARMERRRLLAPRYQHTLRAELSPLIWNGTRAHANAVFRAPLMRFGVKVDKKHRGDN